MADIRANIWKAPSTDEQPLAVAERWTVMRATFANGDVSDHVVAYLGDEHSGRVSSAIQSFDPDKHVAVTRSGRQYKLPLDRHGFDPDGLYVWGAWATDNKVRTFKDVGAEYAGSLLA